MMRSRSLYFLAVICAVMTSGCATLSSLFGSKGIQLPYLGKLSPNVACGGATEYCQPKQAPYFNIRPGADITWNGKPESLIGRMYRSGDILALKDSCFTPTNEKHYVEEGFEFDAKLVETEKATIGAAVTANFNDLLARVAQDKKAKAEFKAALKRATDKALDASARITFRMYSPAADLYSQEGVKSCLQGLPKDHNVITGIAVVEVTDTKWATTLKEELDAELSAKVETALQKAGVQAGADARAEWEKARNLAVTNGMAKTWRFVYAVGYIDANVY